MKFETFKSIRFRWDFLKFELILQWLEPFGVIGMGWINTCGMEVTLGGGQRMDNTVINSSSSATVACCICSLLKKVEVYESHDVIFSPTNFINSHVKNLCLGADGPSETPSSFCYPIIGWIDQVFPHATRWLLQLQPSHFHIPASQAGRKEGRMKGNKMKGLFLWGVLPVIEGWNLSWKYSVDLLFCLLGRMLSLVCDCWQKGIKLLWLA